jgi:DnaJ-domain-containing protein 1
MDNNAFQIPSSTQNITINIDSLKQGLNINSNINSNNLSLNENISQEEKERLAENEIKSLLEEMKVGQPMTVQWHIKRLLNTNFISPYEVLNLSNEVTEEEVKKQFRQMTMLLHPDKCSDPNATQSFSSNFSYFYI